MQDARITLGAVAKRFAILYVPLLFITMALLVVIYQTQFSAIREITELAEQQTTTLAVREMGQGLSPVRGDITYMSNQPALAEFLRQPGTAQWQRLAADYHAFAISKQHYDQVRLVDLNGVDLVRIEEREGRFEIVPPAESRQKAPSRYLNDIQALQPGEIFISRFEKNAAQGGSGQGAQSTLRFAKALYDGEQRKQGAVMLNYVGEKLLMRLRAVERSALGHVWLVSEQGAWMVGPRPEDTLEGSGTPSAQTFSDAFPAAWAKMNTESGKGQFTVGDGLLTYAAITPEDLLQGTFIEATPAKHAVWYFVSYVPAAVLELKSRRLRTHLLVAGSIIAVVLGAATWALAYVNLRRRHAERMGAKAHERYQRLVNNLNVGIYRIQPVGDGEYVEVNAALLRMLRINSKDKLLSRSVKEFYADPAEFEALSRQLMASGAVVESVVEGLRSDGEHFWASLTAVKKTEEDGKVYFDGIISDITQRRAAEIALKESEAKFRGLLESCPDAIIIIDAEGAITLANAQALRLFGYRREELIGNYVEMLLPPNLRARHVNHRARFLNTPELRPMGAILDLYALRKDGELVPIDVSLSPMQMHDGVSVIASIRDVTQRKHAELEIKDLNARLAEHVSELTAVNQELEAFSYSVSHDLRAPLRSIDGFSQALLEDYTGSLDTHGQDYLRRVRAASQYMAQLIDDLLMLSRITRAEMSKEPVNMSVIVKDILASLARSEPARKVRCEVAEYLPVKGDARLLRIALTNLLGNAWKFTSKRPEAVIEVGMCEEPDGNVYYVKDNGAGFNIAYVNKLFGVFQRLHSTQEFPGTGVGLAIVQRVIHRHGGKVWAEGAIDQGATFFFTLSNARP